MIGLELLFFWVTLMAYQGTHSRVVGKEKIMVEFAEKNESARIIMYSVVTVDYLEKVKNYTDAKMDYALEHGYEFILFSGKEHNVDNWAYYSRAHCVKMLLEGMGPHGGKFLLSFLLLCHISTYTPFTLRSLSLSSATFL